MDDAVIVRKTKRMIIPSVRGAQIDERFASLIYVIVSGLVWLSGGGGGGAQGVHLPPPFLLGAAKADRNHLNK
jgi:hypothetical protein